MGMCQVAAGFNGTQMRSFFKKRRRSKKCSASRWRAAINCFCSYPNSDVVVQSDIVVNSDVVVQYDVDVDVVNSDVVLKMDVVLNSDDVLFVFVLFNSDDVFCCC
jgi:hypothetical protein